MKRRMEIAKAKRKVAELRKKYDSGNYSGHPEEMLWDIENAEIALKKLRESRGLWYAWRTSVE